jgi:hypothetical protein
MEEASGAALDEVVALTPSAPAPIRGHVIEVSGDLVTLSVGSADGVRKDMVFIVFRDDQYVCDVKVSMIDPNQAAGRMVQSAQPPKVGDEATDALRFVGSRGK